MDRPNHKGVDFFFGNEVERTPMFQKPTLFVVGVQPISKIVELAKSRDIQHIYFGANHSYNPVSYNEYNQWDTLIKACLDLDLWCTLDMDTRHTENFLDGGLIEYRRFIPMISVKLPYINQLGYNAVLKLDDNDFDSTNPGVWCHRLHDLQTVDTFTSWDDYTNDEVSK